MSPVCIIMTPPIDAVLTSRAVKTLAIRGTSEEVMVARSKALKENKQEFTKEITDDRTIRDFIEVRGTRTSAPAPSRSVFHILTVYAAAPDLPACSHGAARQSRRAVVRARATSHWHRHSTCPSSHPARGPAATTCRPYCRCRRHACTTTTTITITTSSPSSSASLHRVCRDPHGAAPQETEAGAVYGRIESHADPFASSHTHATILLAVLCSRLIHALLPLAVVFLLLFSLPVSHVSICVRCTLRTTTPFCFPKGTSVCTCLHLPQGAYISLTMRRGGKVINDRSIRNHRNPYRKARRLA